MSPRESETITDKQVDKQDILEEDISDEDYTPTRRQPWLGVLLTGLLLGAGVIGWRTFAPGKTSQPATAQQAPKTPPPRPVETTTLTTGQGMRSFQLLGQVEATQQATIRAQTGGILKQIMVQPGDRVTPGMTIAVLDDADQKLALSQAEAQLAQQRSNMARLEVGTRPEIIAQRQAAVRSTLAREKEARDNLQRNTNLVREGAISQRLLVEARAAVDDAHGERLAAEATLKEAQAGATREEMEAQRALVGAAAAAVNQARLAVQRTKITSNSTGIVQERKVSVGDLVQTGGEIASLVAGDKLDVFLELPEELTGRVNPGTRVELTARALPNWKSNATITGVIPSADGASRRQRVRVQLNNPPRGLVSGMAVTGTLQSATNQPSFVVSRDVLTKRQDKWFVYTVAEGRAKQQEVQMVADMGEKVAIYHPALRAGQEIVSRGGDMLTDGAAIREVSN